MLTECVQCIQVALLLIFLLFWPGFVLQRVLIGTDDALEVFVFSTGFGLAFYTIMCPVLDVVWNISVIPFVCSIILLSGLLIFRKPQKIKFPEKWELFIIVLILCYGFLLRSYTLFDILPEGQDPWWHLSFIDHIHQTHALPQVLPWLEPERLVTIQIYPPGAHCIGALINEPLANISFPLTQAFFITLGTGSVLSSYVVFRKLLEKKVALLSTFFVAVFLPHMGMTTEITAQAVAIFSYPLVLYFFYKGKWIASGILLGAVILIHHLTALAVVFPLLTFAVVCLLLKKWKYFLSFFLVSGIALALSAPWWMQRTLFLTWPQPEVVGGVVLEVLYNPYIEMISPLFVVLSMVGFFLFLKRRGDFSLFLIVWAVVLFVAAEPASPIKFSNHRFLAFFVFPCSVMASMGFLEVKKRLKKIPFVLLLLLVFFAYPPHFWSTTGEENLIANEWMEDSTLDSVFYVYGPRYTFVYPLSHRRIYRIYDFDNPFGYEGEKAEYFYDDSLWIPHDISRFGEYDRVYSCFGVVIYRIE